jgi:hypothetical protein
VPITPKTGSLFHADSQTKLDISETARWLGYKPAYSLANLLSELATYGDSGPPRLTEN